MKKFFLLIALGMFSLAMNAQNDLNSILDNYRGDSEVTVVSINGSMFKLGADFMDEGDAEQLAAKKMAQQINGLTIVNTKSKDKAESINKVVDKLIKSKKFEEMMDVDSNGEKVKFYGLVEKGLIKELFLVVNDKNEYTIIAMNGSIDPKEAGKFVNKMKKH